MIFSRPFIAYLFSLIIPMVLRNRGLAKRYIGRGTGPVVIWGG